jgi:hypothetical protein
VGLQGTPTFNLQLLTVLTTTSASPESRFVTFEMGITLSFPFYGLNKLKSMGIMTFVASPQAHG